MKKILYILVLLITSFTFAQVHTVSMLNLGPRTTAEMNAITVAQGLQEGSRIDNSDTGTTWRYNGTIWEDLGTGGGTDLLPLNNTWTGSNTFEGNTFFTDGSVVIGSDGLGAATQGALLFVPQTASPTFTGANAGLLAYNREFMWQTGISGQNFILDASDVTATRTFTLPDASGTLALTSDITGGTDDQTASEVNVIVQNDVNGPTVQDELESLVGFVNQDVTSGSSPTFDGTNITGVVSGAVQQLNLNGRAGTSTITSGQPVYASAYNVGGWYDLEIADASNANLMPAIGLTTTSTTTSTTVAFATAGRITGLDTSLWSENDALYVASGGGLTNVRPTGSSNYVQKIGFVARSHVSAGVIQLVGAGRSNDVPNIGEGQIWLGNASGVAVPTILNASEVPITDSGALYTATDVEGALAEVKGLADSALQSTTTGEPTGATVIPNKVEIDYADYRAARIAATLVTGTEYTITGGPGVVNYLDMGGDYSMDNTTADNVTFTMENIQADGYYEVLYDQASAPVVTGATQVTGTAAFVANQPGVLAVKVMADGSTVKYTYTQL